MGELRQCVAVQGTKQYVCGKMSRASPKTLTEQGVAMPARVLLSPNSVDGGDQIKRIFARLRGVRCISARRDDLKRQLAAFARKVDGQTKAVVAAINHLMMPLARIFHQERRFAHGRPRETFAVYRSQLVRCKSLQRPPHPKLGCLAARCFAARAPALGLSHRAPIHPDFGLGRHCPDEICGLEPAKMKRNGFVQD